MHWNPGGAWVLLRPSRVDRDGIAAFFDMVFKGRTSAVQTDSTIVIGAGIGGLTLALGLQRAGRPVIVCEAAPALAEIGAGITITPNATRALEFLGLAETLARLGDRPEGGYLMRSHLGENIYVPPVETKFRDRHGAELYQIHRADLQDALAAAVRANDASAIRTGHGFQALTQDATSVTARFSNNEIIVGSALIGCDGLRSAVRAALYGSESPRFTGQVAYRGLVPVARLEDPAAMASSTVFIGPGSTFTRYFIRNRGYLNYVAMVETDSWRQEGWSSPATKNELREVLDGWHPEVGMIVGATPEENLHKWALFDRDPLEKWATRRVTLLGDAAHPMLPFLGMGAAMAIEDAVVLARCVADSSSPERAFERYETARAARTTQVLLKSRSQGKIYQNRSPDRLARPTAPGELELGLFDYDPATALI
jgi:salicylate hydroxylase